MRLSVVIPCLDVEALLPTQLEALSHQIYDEEWEVVVADNGSSDRTREVALSFVSRLPRLQIVSAQPRGRQHACNIGARHARGEGLIFVDGDDEVAPGFLAAVAAALREWDLIGGRLEHRRLNPGSSGTVGSFQTDELSTGFGFLPYASGGCVGIRRTAFEAVGGFAQDKDFCEDVDLSWRVQLRGLRIGFCPAAVVSVRQRSTSTRMFHQHRNFGRAQALLYRDFREEGMPRRSLWSAPSECLALVRSLFALRTSDQRQRWLRRSGRFLGRLEGSLRYKVLYL